MPTKAKDPPACPFCNQPLIAHKDSTNPFKDGCWHCDSCGSCWLPDLSAQREGHPAPVGASE